MKKTITSLMGLITVLTLVFGIHTPIEKQQTFDIIAYADGDHH